MRFPQKPSLAPPPSLGTHLVVMEGVYFKKTPHMVILYIFLIFRRKKKHILESHTFPGHSYCGFWAVELLGYSGH